MSGPKIHQADQESFNRFCQSKPAPIRVEIAGSGAGVVEGVRLGSGVYVLPFNLFKQTVEALTD